MLRRESPFSSTTSPASVGTRVRRPIASNRRVAGASSPIMQLQKLVDVKDDASQQLGRKVIKGVECEGLEIEMAKVDPNVGEGTLTVWVDRQKQLPVMVSMRMANVMPAEMIMENILWNIDFEESLFSTHPPEGYALDKPSPGTPETEEKRLASITSAFQLFAEMNKGKYPQVTVIYGDVTRDTLMKLAGYANREPGKWMQEEQYQKIQQSTIGWATINQIMRTDAEASYHGLEVGPTDKDKVLFRFKLADGSYQVIFGDLRTEKVSK